MNYSFQIFGLATKKVRDCLATFTPEPIESKQDIVDLFKANNIDLNKAFLTDNYTGETKSLSVIDQELNN